MKKRYLCMAAIIFLMNTLTGCALKNENMEAIYKEFLDNGDVGSLQWSWVLEPGQYEDIRFVNDNMVAVQNGSDKWGVWDLEKEILVTSCKYNNIPNDAARYYSEGYAAVQKDGKWGFVDEAGQCVIPCQYDEVGDFSEGLAAVKDADHNGKGEQWAYIDTKGEIQIDFYPYEATEGRRVLAGEFHDGMAFVSKGLYCIMDTKDVDQFRRECLSEMNAGKCENAVLLVSTFVHNRAGFQKDGTADNELGNGWGCYDLGLQNENLILKAEELGYGTLIMGIRDADKIREFCSVPETETVVAVIAVGVPGEEPGRPKRKDTEEIVKFL